MKLKNGTECESLEQLRENFDEQWAVGALRDGSLAEWLGSMYYEDELNALPDDPDDEKVVEKIRAVLNIPDLEKQNELEARLRGFTDDTELLKRAKDAVYSQKELAEKLDSGECDIILAGGDFCIPLSVRGVTYTVAGKPNIRCAERTILAAHHIRIVGHVFDGDNGNSELLSQLAEAFSIPKPDHYIMLKKRVEDYKRFDRRSECQEHINTSVAAVYEEAARYLDTSSGKSLAKEMASHYSDSLQKALEDNKAQLDSLCTGDKASLLGQLEKLCDCYRKLLDVYNKEMNEGDYYTLYKLDYFQNIPDIEEIGELKPKLFREWDFKEVTKYYSKGSHEVNTTLEKDLNELARTFRNFAEREYKKLVEKPVIELLKQLCG